MNMQLDPMRKIVGQLKKEKDSASKKIVSLEKDMQGLIDKLRVSTQGPSRKVDDRR